MSIYLTSLLYAIPTFILLILIEMIVANVKGIKINRPEDMISSLSSGMTNTTRDGLKLGFAIISYTWLVDNFTIYTNNF